MIEPLVPPLSPFRAPSLLSPHPGVHARCCEEHADEEDQCEGDDLVILHLVSCWSWSWSWGLLCCVEGFLKRVYSSVSQCLGRKKARKEERKTG